MRQKIFELYKEHPRCKDILEEKFNTSLNTMLAEVPEKNNISIRDLESHKISYLHHLLGHLPRKKILQSFGEDILLWNSVGYPYTPHSKTLRQIDCELLGISEDFFYRSINGFWQLYLTDNTNHIRKSMSLFEKVSQLTATSLQPYLQEQTLFEEFEVKPFYTRYQSKRGYVDSLYWKKIDNLVFTPFCDAPISFGILNNSTPIAMTSFFPKNDVDVLIYQMQGIRGYILNSRGGKKKQRVNGKWMPISARNKKLKGFPLKDYFVDTISKLVKKEGYRRIGIQSAENNYLTKPNKEGEIHISRDAAFKVYDEYALKNNFKYGRDGNLWKSL